ncbi:hypothetical protein HYH03_006833 [Edaphochlamys debaryana]|uniref:Uncharacterized protein n=1 Tax=Edaphochlamys debaryana TaxID=47281 RepID=A0A835Y2V1_9CHLO|nr:hypothetical protein HYH03_006833 [Edaphochlamys debaryana]|eukprot:KAG2494898.1 hypothetical protein HYH03_006833 [Edaphochlamys debaryana]
MRGHPDAKYLVWTCFLQHDRNFDRTHCAGLGDRMRGIAFAVRLAAATQRVLLVHQEVPAPLEHFLAPAHIDWRLTPDLGIDTARDVAQSRVHFRYSAAHDKAQLASDLAQGLLWNETARRQRVVTLATNMPLSWEPDGAGGREGGGGRGARPHLLPPAPDDGHLPSALTRALFRLSPGLEAATDAALASVGVAPGQPFVAVHLRLGGQVGEERPIHRHRTGSLGELLGEAERCAHHLASSLAPPAPGAAVGTGTHLVRDRPVLPPSAATTMSPTSTGATDRTGARLTRDRPVLPARNSSTPPAAPPALAVPGLALLLITDNAELRAQAAAGLLPAWRSPRSAPLHFKTHRLPHTADDAVGLHPPPRELDPGLEPGLDPGWAGPPPTPKQAPHTPSATGAEAGTAPVLSRMDPHDQIQGLDLDLDLDLVKLHLASLADFGVLVRARCLVLSRSGFSEMAHLLGGEGGGGSGGGGEGGHLVGAGGRGCSALLEPRDRGGGAGVCPRA